MDAHEARFSFSNRRAQPPVDGPYLTRMEAPDT
jgi:hypothetical protein